MYEGQPIICKDIVEEHWLEYLAYVKELEAKREEANKKRREALKDIEGDDCPRTESSLVNKVVADYYYYDVSIQQFWNWYISHKV